MVIDGKEKVYEIDDAIFHCGVAVCYRYIGGKWKSIIIWNLREGVLRFSEIKAQIPDMTDKMLSLQLKALKDDGLVAKTVFGKKAPFKVEYRLTPLGETLIPVIEGINNWGIVYAENEGKLIDVV
jgi:DNA-binding HxlR family transcriptional regulator